MTYSIPSEPVFAYMSLEGRDDVQRFRHFDDLVAAVIELRRDGRPPVIRKIEKETPERETVPVEFLEQVIAIENR